MERDTITITDTIAVPRAEIEIGFVRAPGPGGQNVNKVATAARLRFDLAGSPSLPQGVKTRAARMAGQKLTNDGVIVISASRFRTQPQNERDAIDRLAQLLRRAATPPKRRIPTKPTLASKRRRIDTKTKRGSLKKLRSKGSAIE